MILHIRLLGLCIFTAYYQLMHYMIDFFYPNIHPSPLKTIFEDFFLLKLTHSKKINVDIFFVQTLTCSPIINHIPPGVIRVATKMFGSDRFSRIDVSMTQTYKIKYI